MVASVLSPAFSRCAALPEESDISPKQQDALNEQIYTAIYYYNLPAMQAALNNGADPNYLGLKNKSPLTLAIERNDISMVEALIKAGADPEESECQSKTQTPLYTACVIAKAPDIVTLLINAGADLDGHRRMKNSPLLSITFRPNRPNAYRPTAHDIIQKLIDAGADLNMQSKKGHTALMNAVRRQPPEVVKTLILAGADTTLRDEQGLDITYHATKNREHPDMPQVVQKALEKREGIKQIRKQNIESGKEPAEKQFVGAYTYLLNNPLPIEALTRIFLVYATIDIDTVVLAEQKTKRAKKIQWKRAEKTQREAVEWQTTQRMRRDADTQKTRRETMRAQQPCNIQ